MKTWHVLAMAQRARTSRMPAIHWTVHPPEEDLQQLALAKTPPEDRLRIESHLAHCQECQRSFEEAGIFADRLQELLRSQGKQDQRTSVRYKVRESAIVAQCNPPDFVPAIGQVMDVSATGLRIRLTRAIYRGTQVQVLVEKAAVFGTIRYCRANSRDTYDVGLIIDQIVMRPGGPPIESLDAATGRDGFVKLQPRKTAKTVDPVDVLLIASVVFGQARPDASQLERNKQLLLDFFSYQGDPAIKAARFFADDYIQHNSRFLIMNEITHASGRDAWLKAGYAAQGHANLTVNGGIPLRDPILVMSEGDLGDRRVQRGAIRS